jgi:phosphomevalonate kinase
MGNQAEVPIEPPSQTQLIDATLEIPGALIAGVPGGIYHFCFIIC